MDEGRIYPLLIIPGKRSKVKLSKYLQRPPAMSSQARKLKVKWTEQINKHVLKCKKKVLELVSSENPPCNESGR